jgi:hypothetical protein
MRPLSGLANQVWHPLAEVTTATDELEAASIAAQGGGSAQTAIMHDKEAILDSKLLN